MKASISSMVRPRKAQPISVSSTIVLTIGQSSSANPCPIIAAIDASMSRVDSSGAAIAAPSAAALDRPERGNAEIRRNPIEGKAAQPNRPSNTE